MSRGTVTFEDFAQTNDGIDILKLGTTKDIVHGIVDNLYPSM